MSNILGLSTSRREEVTIKQVKILINKAISLLTNEEFQKIYDEMKLFMSKFTDLNTNYNLMIESLNSITGKVDESVERYKPNEIWIKSIQLPIQDFFGFPTPSIITPKLTEIKDFINKFTTFQSKYEEHVKNVQKKRRRYSIFY